MTVRDGFQRDEAVIARATGDARPSEGHGHRGTLTTCEPERLAGETLREHARRRVLG